MIDNTIWRHKCHVIVEGVPYTFIWSSGEVVEGSMGNMTAGLENKVF